MLFLTGLFLCIAKMEKAPFGAKIMHVWYRFRTSPLFPEAGEYGVKVFRNVKAHDFHRETDTGGPDFRGPQVHCTFEYPAQEDSDSLRRNG